MLYAFINICIAQTCTHIWDDVCINEYVCAPYNNDMDWTRGHGSTCHSRYYNCIEVWKKFACMCICMHDTIEMHILIWYDIHVEHAHVYTYDIMCGMYVACVYYKHTHTCMMHAYMHDACIHAYVHRYTEIYTITHIHTITCKNITVWLKNKAFSTNLMKSDIRDRKMDFITIFERSIWPMRQKI